VSARRTVVVTDLDGTLWSDELVVGPRTRAAVQELLEAGVPVLAATARRPRGAREILARNGLDLPLVGLNGAMGRHADRTPFHDAFFAPDDARTAYRAFADHGFAPCLYVDEADYDVVLAREPSTNPGHVEYLRPVARVAGDLEAVAHSEPLYGFSLLGLPRGALEPAVADLTAAGIPHDFAPEPQWAGWSINAMPRGVSKWSGITAFCAAIGVAADDVLAVGDGTNDLEMLARAARPFVVAGSRAAARVNGAGTIAPPERDGWAALAAHVLG
jgi:hydroxymethylpyrimidine pyrophosphatase-like HAD family hydrolase